MPAPLSPLSHRAGVRRPLLHPAGGGRPGGYPAAGPGRRDPHHVRRPRFSEWPRPLAEHRARDARRISPRDLRLHGQNRATPQASAELLRAQITRLLIPPGSALLTRSDVRRFLGPLDQAGFQYQWTHPDPRMDKLHREVSAAVEAAASTSEDPVTIFDRLRAIAYRFADRQPAALTASRTPSRNRHRPPRLTEPWFCCAEPTERQLHPLHTKGCGEV